MVTSVLILSASPRKGSNSDLLAENSPWAPERPAMMWRRSSNFAGDVCLSEQAERTLRDEG